MPCRSPAPDGMNSGFDAPPSYASNGGGAAAAAPSWTPAAAQMPPPKSAHQPAAPVSHAPKAAAKALFDFDAQNEGELDFKVSTVSMGRGTVDGLSIPDYRLITGGRYDRIDHSSGRELVRRQKCVIGQSRPLPMQLRPSNRAPSMKRLRPLMTRCPAPFLPSQAIIAPSLFSRDFRLFRDRPSPSPLSSNSFACPLLSFVHSPFV